jgi:iron complex transport system ATP-binding protein
MAGATVLELSQASVRRTGPDGERRFLLRAVDWRVRAGEHWALLGPNGAGKTTLLRLASTEMLPSFGTMAIFGHRRGTVHVDRIRPHIGLVQRGVADRFQPGLTVLDVVTTGVTGTIALLRDRIGLTDVERARSLLQLVGVESLADRPFRACSEGERGRAMLARALAADASLLLLDEPGTGLDLPGRELLIGALSAVAREHPQVATIVATQHVEELAPETSHVVLLRAGEVVAAGLADETLTDQLVSECFGLPVRVTRSEGRFSAVAVRSKS